jgi:CubicO group peptidase (beta-lactamase class C family)
MCQQDSSPFIGFWHAIYHYYAPPFQVGKLTVEETGKGQYTAIVLKTKLSVSVSKNNIECFNNIKTIGFRGKFSKDNSRITGYWIQNRYASPLTLIKSKDEKSWEGLPDVYSSPQDIFFKISKDSSGSLITEVYDRGFNLEAFIKINRTITDKGFISMFRGNDSLPILKGVLTTQGTIVCIAYFDKTASLTLTKTDPKKEISLNPRLSNGYAYSVPPQGNDGWLTNSPDSVGINRDTINSLVNKIISGTSFPKVFSLLIARHNKLVLEEYFHGFTYDDPQDTRSAGKTLTSTLTGIAIDKGFIKNDSAAVYPFFKKYKSFDHWAPGKKLIKIKHLLTMSSGLDCNDFNDDSPGNENLMQSRDTLNDWSKYILDLPLVNKPGEKSYYCSGGVNLLGDIITEASGLQMPEFIQKYLFDPLGIQNYYFNLTPTLNGYMAGGIRLRPRDMLKFGQLYLNGGLWNKTQVISTTWIYQSLVPRVSINGRGPDYGYLWWYDHFEFKGERFDCYSAQGNGGQFILIIPRLDLTCVITGGNYGQFRKWINFKKIISDYIIPACKE